jgi:hypothetical protein
MAGEPIRHEAVEASSVFSLAATLIVDYARVKAHVVGSALDAALVYLDARVWPVTAMSAPILMVALVVGAGRGRRVFGGGRARRDVLRLALVICAVVGAVVVIGRGTLGGRYHLMYLPAAWMLGGLWLGGRPRRWSRGALLGLLLWWAAYSAVACSWLDWDAGVVSEGRALAALPVLMVIAGGVWLGYRRATRSRRAAVGLTLATLAVAAAVVAGPVQWAAYARFEPMARSQEMALLDGYWTGRTARPAPTGRTLYIDLANYYLTVEPETKRNIAWAVHYARLETKRVPDDARAWAYLGEALFRAGAPVDEVRAAWERSLELERNAKLRERMERLSTSD